MTDYCPACHEAVHPLPYGACPNCYEIPVAWDKAPPDSGDRAEKSWWEERRARFNLGLVVAGFLAFVSYAVVLSLVSNRIREPEITIFTMAFQGMAYLAMMVVANMCYRIGPAVESRLPETWRPSFRRRAFAAGCIFSFSLPFTIPVTVWLTYHGAPAIR